MYNINIKFLSEIIYLHVDLGVDINSGTDTEI